MTTEETLKRRTGTKTLIAEAMEGTRMVFDMAGFVSFAQTPRPQVSPESVSPLPLIIEITTEMEWEMYFEHCYLYEA